MVEARFYLTQQEMNALGEVFQAKIPIDPGPVQWFLLTPGAFRLVGLELAKEGWEVGEADE